MKKLVLSLIYENREIRRIHKTLQNGSTACPHLRKWNMACCLAGNTGVVLAFMIKKYCKSINHKNCLFFKDSRRSKIAKDKFGTGLVFKPIDVLTASTEW